MLHSLGAPLGEAVAEDFDFIRHNVLLGHHSLLDGGGSVAFWRPVPHQLYYMLLGPYIVSHPSWIAAIHVVLLVLTAVLLYRTMRPSWSGPWAAAVAGFPFLSESTRTVISWPGHFVEVGSLMFAVLALHEAVRRRMGTSLAALVLALLCKEVAIVVAPLLPLLPRIGPTPRSERVRWAIGAGAVTAVWALAYLAVRRSIHLELPHNLEHDATVLSASAVAKLGWALWNSVRAIFSLPAVAVSRQMWILMGALVVPLAAFALIGRDRAAGARAARAMPWILWGVGWFVLASAALTPIFPIWAPNRSLFGSVGLGIALTALVGSAAPPLLVALVALRLAAFAVAPGPPARISVLPAETGAFMDFERLTRLQRLMRESREVLQRRLPHLAHGTRIGTNNFPRGAEYALGGDHAIQVWYSDTTLHMARFHQNAADSTMAMEWVVQYQLSHDPQLVLVSAAAMRKVLQAEALLHSNQGERVRSLLASADSMVTDPDAVVFRGTLMNIRSASLFEDRRVDEAVAEARRGLAILPEKTDPRYLLAWISYMRGDQAGLRAQLDTLQALTPDDTLLVRFRALLRPGLRH